MGALFRILAIMLVFSGVVISNSVAETYLLVPPSDFAKSHNTHKILVTSSAGDLPLKNYTLIRIADVIVANLSDSDAVKLKALGWGIVKDYNVSLSPYRVESFLLSNSTSDTNYWNLRWIEADRVWKLGINGSGVKVAVIDTGVAPHPDLKDRIAEWRDFVNGRDTPYDDNGHGTHVAGIIAGKRTGVAPGAQLLVAKVFDRNGVAPLSRILQAFQWAVDNGADVVSYSAGMLQVERFTGRGTLDINNSTASHIFPVEKYRYEVAFKPSAIVIYVSSEDGNYLNVSLSSPAGSVNLSDMVWLRPGDNAWYFAVGNNFTAKEYVSSAPLAPGNWTLVVSANLNDSQKSLSYTYTVLVIYQSDGSSVLDRAVRRITSNGTVFVCASGNDGLLGFRTVNTPATEESAISVGATAYMHDHIADFSSRGPVGFYNLTIKPDLVAPGERILSTFYSPFGGYGYATLSGTSMATPHVSGTVALLLQIDPSLTPENVKKILEKTSVDLGIPGPDYVYGWGRISALSAALEAFNESNLSVPVRMFVGLDDVAKVNDVVNITALSWAKKPLSGVNITLQVAYNGSPVFNTTMMTDSWGMARFRFIPEHSGEYALTLSDEYGNVVSGILKVVNGSDIAVIPQDRIAVPNSTLDTLIPVIRSDLTPVNGVAKVYLVDQSSRVFNTTLNITNGNLNLSINLSGTEFDDNGWSGELIVEINGTQYHAGSIRIADTPLEVRVVPWGVVDGRPGDNITFVVHAFDPATFRPFDAPSVNVSVVWVTDSVYGNVIFGRKALQNSLIMLQSLVNITETVNVPLRYGVGTFSLHFPENAYFGVVTTETGGTVIIYGSFGWLGEGLGTSIIRSGIDWDCSSRCTAKVYASLRNGTHPVKNETVYFYTANGEMRASRTNEYGIAVAEFENVTGSVSILAISENVWDTLESEVPCNSLSFDVGDGYMNLTANSRVYLQVLRNDGLNGSELVFSGILNVSDHLRIHVTGNEYRFYAYDGNDICRKTVVVPPIGMEVRNEWGKFEFNYTSRGIIYAALAYSDGFVISMANNTSVLDVSVDMSMGSVEYYSGFSNRNVSFVIGSDTVWFSFVYGDVDGDGLLTEKDVVLLAKIILGFSDMRLSADLTGDGSIDISDLVRLVYCLEGLCT